MNSELVLLYWQIGRRIWEEILTEDRADYGKRVVEALSDSLKSEYGSGFGRRNLFNTIRFAEVYQDPEIVQTLSAQLSWSHLRESENAFQLMDMLLIKHKPKEIRLQDQSPLGEF